MISIRTAVLTDVGAIKILSDIWVSESPMDVDYTNVRVIRQAILKGLTWVAVDNKEIIGFLIVKLKKSKVDRFYGLKKGDDYLEVDSIYVKKEYRTKHLGVKLLQVAEDFAKSKNLKYVIISAQSSELKKLMDFYIKNKYNLHYLIMYKVLEDEDLKPKDEKVMTVEIAEKDPSNKEQPFLQQEQKPASK